MASLQGRTCAATDSGSKNTAFSNKRFQHSTALQTLLLLLSCLCCSSKAIVAANSKPASCIDKATVGDLLPRSMSEPAAAEKRLTRQQLREQEQELLPAQGQQQQQLTALSLAGLRTLLLKEVGEQSDLMTVFSTLQELCSTDDVAALLSGPGHFEQLQKHLQESGKSASTCSTYMRRLLRALELPQVQQLLQPDVLRSLQDKAKAAIAELQLPPSAAAAAATPGRGPRQALSPAAAAAAAGDATPGRGARTLAQMPGVQTLQQQQQQQPGRFFEDGLAEKVTVEDIRTLLSDFSGSGSITHSQSAVLTRWSAAAGSDDMAVLLQQANVEALLQGMQAAGGLAPGTCCEYLRAALDVLELPELRELLSQQQLQDVEQMVQAELDSYRKAENSVKAARKAQKRAAAAAAGGGEAGGVPGMPIVQAAAATAAVGPAAAAAAAGGGATPGRGARTLTQVPGMQTLQQQQQQQQQPGRFFEDGLAERVTVEDVHTLLLNAGSCGGSLESQRAVLKQWSAAAGSNDMAVLLQHANVGALLQGMQAAGDAKGSRGLAPGTCCNYLRAALEVLELPPIRQLLSQQQLQQVEQMVQAELDRCRKEANDARAARKAQKRAAAAAAAGGVPGMPVVQAAAATAAVGPAAAAAGTSRAGAASAAAGGGVSGRRAARTPAVAMTASAETSRGAAAGPSRAAAAAAVAGATLGAAASGGGGGSSGGARRHCPAAAAGGNKRPGGVQVSPKT
jgi:hypothetical protein